MKTRLHYREAVLCAMHEDKFVVLDEDLRPAIQYYTYMEENFEQWYKDEVFPKKLQIICFDDVPEYTYKYMQAPPIRIKSLMMYLIDVAFENSLDYPWYSMGDFTIRAALSRLNLPKGPTRAHDVASCYWALTKVHWDDERIYFE